MHQLAADSLPAIRSALADDTPAELVQLAAGPIPAGALFALFSLGEVPPDLKRWSQDSLELFWGVPDEARQLEAALSAADYYRWLRTMVARARAVPGTNLFSALVGIGLDDDHVCAAAYFLLIAGQETTSMLISSIMLRLLASPGRWPLAGVDDDYVAAAVEAALREESSVPTWRRTTRAPVAVEDTMLPPNAELLLTLTGVGADANLAFGVGAHRCLGAALARLEARVVVQTIARAFPNLILIEPRPPRIELLSFAAPARLLVTQTKATQSPDYRHKSPTQS